MRDLKHLIYFESLLENADNDLVKQAQAEGKLAIGYTCYHMPEPLLNLPGCFSVRLRAPAPVHWTSLPTICPTTPVNMRAPWWSAAWRAATSSWTRWPAWTPVP